MPTSLSSEGHGRSTGFVEVLDRVLDKGLVVAGMRARAAAGVADETLLGSRSQVEPESRVTTQGVCDAR